MKSDLRKKENTIIQNIIDLSKLKNEKVNEIEKAVFLQKLLYSYGIENVKIDVAGNVVAKIIGENQDEAIVISTNLDSVKDVGKIKLTGKELIGVGVGDNLLGVISLAILGEYLSKEKLKHTIYLVGTVNGNSDFSGMKFLLEKEISESIKGVININGLWLGRIHSTTVGLKRSKILFKGIRKHIWRNVVSSSVVDALGNFILKIKNEDFGENSVVNIAGIETGIHYNTVPENLEIKIEIRSNSEEEFQAALNIVKSIILGVGQEENIKVKIKDEVFRKIQKVEENNIEKIFIDVAKERKINIYTGPTNSEIAIPLEKGIEAVTVGIANGGKRYSKNEYIEINSIYTGIEYIFNSIIKYDKS
ncbi:peptidase dimerization domain-containing protein [Haliovirga abyssi]|uniref:Peptidase M20 dimerisation domain-containing protein n=1 Tax=Haliovirga abyssi TaxID=2996794 RepID=A0AAU9DLW3_9FUSO|nr:peptidase dimerization domain-containing protein [Haliovirga abyssi]BDU50967.1 hypothetical protein HLVA_15360 [Haliovirga abyssi]